MKKLALALAFSAVATAAEAQIANSAHDFTNGFTGNGFTATVGACTFCHAPHNANTGVTGAPLWNRPNSAALGTYTMYSSATIDGAMTAQPGANSLTCLACHDGGQAIAVIYNGGTPLNVSGVSNNTSPLSGVNAVGTALTNDHPVGITYDPTKDASLKSLASVQASAFRLYNYGAGATAQVECGTCHDPHSQAFPRFLRAANTTALCSTCHSQ